MDRTPMNNSIQSPNPRHNYSQQEYIFQLWAKDLLTDKEIYKIFKFMINASKIAYTKGRCSWVHGHFILLTQSAKPRRKLRLLYVVRDQLLNLMIIKLSITSVKDWSDLGCKTTTEQNNSGNFDLINCICDHLTSFAVLMVSRKDFKTLFFQH
jgi:hypothetical protein